MTTGTAVDFGGLDLTVNSLLVGASTPGSAGTSITTTENATTVNVGASGTAGTFKIFPATASKGDLKITATNNTGNTETSITNAAMGQATALTIPDPGGATANFVLSTGTSTTTTATSTELNFLSSASNANSGTSKAMITGTSGALTVAGVATFNANPTFGTGFTLKANSGTPTLSSNTAAVTKYANQVTTESLTTAAGASQALTLTLTGFAATDLAFVTSAGGTNTRKNYRFEAVMTSNTCTVTVYNTEPTNALNGTLIFNLWIVKA